MSEQLSIRVPFCGFYHSVADGMIERAIENFFSEIETGSELPVPDDVYWDLNFQKIQVEYAQLYLEGFNKILNDELDINIKLVYEELDSPREYNFTTDRIFAKISEKDVYILGGQISSDAMAETVKKHFTSYDGFMSYYSNDYYGEDWQKNINEYDANELSMFLYAFSENHWEHGIDDYEVMEVNYAYETIDNLVYSMLSDLGYEVTEENQIMKNGEIITD